ncbi:MAG: hypothetical protein A3F46_07645 [Legionellales bacterium RIFCSPHIGHO2_12_FULL_42_9]|nr:MAG: hypothetical protein A3F46_07645 [Legionellales bacterium RIFCSPHIGHO2_12_FULL_42_9]
MNSKPSILFLADTTHPAQVVHDHIQAVTSAAQLSWHVLNPTIIKILDKLDLSCFDAVGLHYSVKLYNNYYLSLQLKKKLAEYSGIKFLFLQDEYQRVNQIQDFLAQTGFHVLFTLVNPHYLKTSYPDQRLINLIKIPVLTGYVSEDMKTYSSTPIRDRGIDVSYRARRCEFWLGRLAYEKQWIADEFIKQTEARGLKLDISLEEQDRIYNDAWLDLLGHSKAVLGTESGSSIWDFDRSIEKKTNQFLKKNRQANFETVYENVLKEHDGIIMYSAISPRVFEAAAMKTAMIMFPGYYSGVCEADKHYIVLENDFSNLESVLEKLNDVDFLQELVERTHQDLIVSGRYAQEVFAQKITDVLQRLIPKKSSYFESELICQMVNATFEKYHRLNRLRRAKTEMVFMVNQFFQFAFDGKYRVRDRIHLLVIGLKRYITYCSPRLKKAPFHED